MRKLFPLFATCLLAGCASAAPAGEDMGSASQAASMGGPVVPFPQWYQLQVEAPVSNPCLEQGGHGYDTNFFGPAPCNPTNQRQAFRPDGDPFAPAGLDQVFIHTGSAGCLDALNLNQRWGAVANSTCSDSALGEKWQVFAVDQYGFTTHGMIKNLGENFCVSNGLCGKYGAACVTMLDCLPNDADGHPYVPASERFHWIPLDAPLPSFKFGYAASLGQRCLDNNGPNFQQGKQLQAWDCNGSGAQQFRWDPWHRTIKDLSTGLCLDANDGPTNGAVVREWPCNGFLNQQWQVTNDGQIVSYLNGGCLEIGGARLDNGAPVQTWACWGGLNQQWTHYQ